MRRAVLLTLLAVLVALPLTGQGRFSADAKKIIPAAIKLLDQKDSTIWQPAMQALAGLKKTSVPYLIERVRNSPPRVLDPGGVRAVQILDRIGPRAVAAVPALLDALPTGENRLQVAIVQALGRLGPYSGKHRRRIRKAMVELVEDDPTVRKLEPRFVEHFRQFVQEQQGAWRTHARTRLDPNTPLPSLVDALEDPNPFLREFAAELLAKPRPRNETAVAALVKMMGQKQPTKAAMDDVDDTGDPQREIDVFYDRRIHAQVARAIVRMAPDDKRALKAYEYLLERPISAERLDALVAMRQAGPLAEKLLPFLLRMAQREDLVIQREAVTILGMIGPKAKAAIPTLKKLVLGTDKQLAARAKAALAQIDSGR
jgi:HEAT repeat protein